MISVIAYGRNDSYGLQTAKRVTISINAMAQMLDPDIGDEIIYVDYNTADELPSLPECLADTFTARALSLLRVLRVRKSHHKRFAEHTHLPVLEPIARNVAIRRANPANRWLLNTNTDMVFLVRQTLLANAVQGLPDGFYHSPRFEIPEAAWMRWPRQRPEEFLPELAAVSRPLRLERWVSQNQPVVVDSPGDFQLALRSDVEAVGGFNENMIHGWHLDTNLALRIDQYRGELTRLMPDDLRGYHCTHTLAPGHLHSGVGVENSWEEFITYAANPDLRAAQPTWGLLDEEIEEIDLSPANRLFFPAAARVLAPGASPDDPTAGEPRALLAAQVPEQRLYATTLFATLSFVAPTATIAWSGTRIESWRTTRAYLAGLGHAGTWLLDPGCALVDRHPQVAAEPGVRVRAIPTWCDPACGAAEVVVVEGNVTESGEHDDPLALTHPQQSYLAHSVEVLRTISVGSGLMVAGGQQWDPMVVGLGMGSGSLQLQFHASLDCPLAPTSTGVAVGRRRIPARDSSLLAMIGAARRTLGLSGGFWSESSWLIQEARAVVDGESHPLAPDQLAAVAAVLAHPTAAHHLRRDPAAVRAAAAALTVPDEESLPHPSQVLTPRGRDWRDERWLELARLLHGPFGRATLWQRPEVWWTTTVLRACADLVTGRLDGIGLVHPALAVVGLADHTIASHLMPWFDTVTLLDEHGSDIGRTAFHDGARLDLRRFAAVADVAAPDVVAVDLAALPEHLDIREVGCRARVRRLLIGYHAQAPAVVLLDVGADGTFTARSSATPWVAAQSPILTTAA